ncbi:B12-binding domain-containing radical SAM protein [Clostridium sp. JN-9]|uniref:B12-binding domain-containing radical SAM protein n=1 Tax=Clostridium sp. JN-9 TaxID=2507159 RepID=UPI000FFDF926|nr:B12-binding domain-containing radical SAM protein [Clostridium sp. JN-9]QAT40289.1 DUF4080 domain-containing protein [Clostridium sp. JN-9]
MKVLLTAINSKFIHSNLAVRYLKKYTDNLPYECEIKEFTINDRKEKILHHIIESKPDIVAFSCYIWNKEYVLSISRLIKLIDNNIKILYGGPEVSYHCQEFLKESSADFLVEGEGEETYFEFINSLISSSNSDNTEVLNSLIKIKGLYTKLNDKIFYGGKRELMDINKVKFPYDSLDDLSNKIVYYEASRGCPFNCIYCLSSTIHGVRFLSLDRIKKDLMFLINKKVSLIKFVDRTFNCNHEFAYEIWKFLINVKTDTCFHFEISADLFTNDEIELLKTAPKGRFQFEVGVQTTNDNILKNINRYVKFAQIKEKVLELEKLKNIKQHLDLIAGLPGENLQSFKNSFNEVYSIYPEEIQLGFLKVLKGSAMEDDASKWGIVYSPYPPYEVLKTNDLSYSELITLKKVEAMVDKYYNSGKFKNILKYFCSKYENSYDFYYDLSVFFDSKGYFDRSITANDYYKVFLEFNNEVLNDNTLYVNELVKFDFLLYNRKKLMPEYFTRNLSKNQEKEIIKTIENQGMVLEKTYFIEKFFIDVKGFMETSEIKEKNCYYIFKNHGEFIDLKI